MADDLYKLTAREAVARLKKGEVSPVELVESALARIAATDGAVNALPTLCPERARRAAGKVRRDSLLAGLPIAIKDLTDVAGVRTTYGSPIFATHVPERSDLLVERLERNGAVVLAKSNTPEFGAGGNTFNEVFGATRNPWNTALTCGGSSGGAAVAVATGQVWLATGSDLAGSLRLPASFCGVMGLRPSVGRVPHGPKIDAFDTLSTDGPMARNTRDLALFLDAMAGTDPGDPLGLPAPAQSFAAALEAPVLPQRVGFSADLGCWPVAAEVKAICTAAARRLAQMGAIVDDTCPDLRDAREIFQVLRALKFATGHLDRLAHHRDKLKPDVIWNAEKGLALSAEAIARAIRARGALFDRVAAFFRDHDLLLCPAAIVPPFPVEERYVTEVEGHRFDNYIDWLGITYAITLTGCPALSIPCGFSAEGWPVGLQMVGKPRGEAALLAAAALFEDEMGLSSLLPIDPRS